MDADSVRPNSFLQINHLEGVDMCFELVTTRGFAALLSDEVFADVDLEALQASVLSP